MRRVDEGIRFTLNGVDLYSAWVRRYSLCRATEWKRDETTDEDVVGSWDWPRLDPLEQAMAQAMWAKEPRGRLHSAAACVCKFCTGAESDGR